ncbi:MAG: hypothetical protein JJE52_14425 [Acidimicrobiia bacterium]|nr:hypothetical protein [Acidimicrobiia bacterium]
MARPTSSVPVSWGRRIAIVLVAGLLGACGSGPGQGVDAAPEPGIADDGGRATGDESPAGGGSVAPDRSSPVVIYYSDSIGSESMGNTRLALGDQVDLVDRSFPGSALCDWHDRMAGDLARWAPDLVVLQFVGNHLSQCAASADPITATPSIYADHVASVSDLWTSHGVPIVWMSAPRSLYEPLAVIQDGLDEVYLASASGHPLVSFADPGAELESPDRKGARHLPCAPWETADHGCVDGEISVRHADGIHLCQAGDEVCHGYSAGLFRYGTTVAQEILRHL